MMRPPVEDRARLFCQKQQEKQYNHATASDDKKYRLSRQKKQMLPVFEKYANPPNFCHNSESTTEIDIVSVTFIEHTVVRFP